MALAALAGAFVALCWVYRAAMAGDVLSAFAGAALCLGVLAFDMMGGAMLRMGSIVMRCAHRIDSIEGRLAEIELAIDQLDDSVIRNVDLSAGGDHADQLVAANVAASDAFPRLVRPQNEQGTGNDAGQRELNHMVRQELERLQAEFATLVRKGDYAAALHTGERLATLFPDSALSREFDAIRGHLMRRATDDTPSEPASVG